MRTMGSKGAFGIAAAAALSLAGAAGAQVTITGVAGGTEYLQTSTRSFAEIIGANYPLIGVPNAPSSTGNTDTVWQRTKDGVFAPNKQGVPTTTVPVQMMSFNLQGTAGHCTVHISLTPNTVSKGNLTIEATSNTGGTFTSVITVNYSAYFTPPTSCPPNFNDHFTLKQPNGKWQTTPTSGEYLSTSVYPDPTTNQHTGLPTGLVDFYMVGTVRELDPTAQHFVCEAFTEAGMSCP